MAASKWTDQPTATSASGSDVTLIVTGGVSKQITLTNLFASFIAGLLDFQGNLDCSANPNYPAASKGDFYYVSVAGKIGGASGVSVDVGDAVIAKADNAGGTQASVGSSWFTLEHNAAFLPLTGGTISGDLTVTGNVVIGDIGDVHITLTPSGFALGTGSLTAVGGSVSADAIIAAATLTLGGISVFSIGALDATHTAGANIASATTTNLSTATGDYVHITGTTTITAFTSQVAGNERVIVFDGILTLTHNATSLILPGGANITTAAGDRAILRSEGSGNWRCIAYTKANGTAVVSAGGSSAGGNLALMGACT